MGERAESWRSAPLEGLAPLEDVAYVRAQRAFRAATTQHQLILEDVRARLRAREACGRDDVALLSVGSGSGLLDLPLLERLLEEHDRVRYVGVDPNPVACRSLRLGLGRLGDGLEAEVACRPFEDGVLGESFDAVLLVHVLYYDPDPSGILARALECVAEGGRLLVYSAPDNELSQLFKRVTHQLRGFEPWLTPQTEAALERLGCRPRRERRIAELRLPASADGEAEDVLSFLLHADASGLPCADRAWIASYLAGRALPGRPAVTVAHAFDVLIVDRPGSGGGPRAGF